MLLALFSKYHFHFFFSDFTTCSCLHAHWNWVLYVFFLSWLNLASYFCPINWFHSLCVSGEITTTALLDRELKSQYILIVRAVDGGVGPQQKTGIATVITLQEHYSAWSSHVWYSDISLTLVHIPELYIWFYLFTDLLMHIYFSFINKNVLKNL